MNACRIAVLLREADPHHVVVETPPDLVPLLVLRLGVQSPSRWCRPRSARARWRPPPPTPRRGTSRPSATTPSGVTLGSSNRSAGTSPKTSVSASQPRSSSSSRRSASTSASSCSPASGRSGRNSKAWSPILTSSPRRAPALASWRSTPSDQPPLEAGHLPLVVEIGLPHPSLDGPSADPPRRHSRATVNRGRRTEHDVGRAGGWASAAAARGPRCAGEVVEAFPVTPETGRARSGRPPHRVLHEVGLRPTTSDGRAASSAS